MKYAALSSAIIASTLLGCGSKSLNLVDQAELPAGQYQYIRVDVDQEQSGLLIDDASFTFDIPSAAQSGLKLVSPFYPKRQWQC